ncbi:MAG TPA: ribonuclease D [Alphaproteobacteria bacterium]|nr:ribonuclease D [Alphaproteobacteria bacterium]
MNGITVITKSAPLLDYCLSWQQAVYVTVDTEFMREHTYWPKLCLIQVGGPDESVVIDPLAEGIDLTPFFDLLSDRNVLKVFHAARQDVELFHHLTGHVPAPLFDTQLAAMVCGFGESVGYEKLAARLADAQIDKTLRFTDWARRPLTDRQLLYAVADVSHLRPIYDKLSAQLENNGRRSWIDEEMKILTSPATYENAPEDAWKRIKVRNGKPRFLAILREVASWREMEAQRRDVPRNRIIREEALTEIAAHAPASVEELARVRAISQKLAEGDMGRAILKAVEYALSLGKESYPSQPKQFEKPLGMAPLMDLLKVLLKMRCEQSGVAQKLVATVGDLERFAAGDETSPLLSGWRGELFGELALALKGGRVALTVSNGQIQVIPQDAEAATLTAPAKRPRRPRRRPRRGNQRPPDETRAD